MIGFFSLHTCVDDSLISFTYDKKRYGWFSPEEASKAIDQLLNAGIEKTQSIFYEVIIGANTNAYGVDCEGPFKIVAFHGYMQFPAISGDKLLEIVKSPSEAFYKTRGSESSKKDRLYIKARL